MSTPRPPSLPLRSHSPPIYSFTSSPSPSRPFPPLNSSVHPFSMLTSPMYISPDLYSSLLPLASRHPSLFSPFFSLFSLCIAPSFPVLPSFLTLVPTALRRIPSVSLRNTEDISKIVFTCQSSRRCHQIYAAVCCGDQEGRRRSD